jgi:hypothetical protein
MIHRLRAERNLLAEDSRGPVGYASREDIAIMQHALGDGGTREDGTRKSPGWRNYYCASTDDEQLVDMVRRGLMVSGRSLNEGRDRYFSVSPLWVTALGVVR